MRAALRKREPARLCPVVEGVEYWVQNGRSGSIRALVLVEALRTHNGASDDPQSWLEAYEQHSDELCTLTRTLYQQIDKRGIVILRGKSGAMPLGTVAPHS